MKIKPDSDSVKTRTSRVELKNISKVFSGGFSALSDISLSIREGEFFVLLGPSGCGKTTLLRMILGLEEVTEGEIFIDGKCVNTVPPGKRDISMVFQNYALFPHMTVAGNISFGLRLRGEKRSLIQKKVLEVSAILGLSDFLERKPGELSGGQRQRVALGRALVRKPSLFLFDEPLSNLDARLRSEMRNELIELHKRFNSTIIYVTHDQVEAMTLGDRICIMDRGKINQVDAPLNIYNRPTNIFSATFIGSPQMNLVKGKLLRKTDDLFSFEGISISSSKYTEFVYERFSGVEIQLGVRPQALNLRANENSVSGKICFVEVLGDRSPVHLLSGGNRIIGVLPPETKVKTGECITLYFNDRDLYFFESSGKSISRE